MPTNANTYNTRITSEALEAAFRERFPAQGGAELVDDLYASGVIQPVFDLATTSAGLALPENLQTAWDFSTDANQVTATSASPTTLITTPGFWKVDLTCNWLTQSGGIVNWVVQINDGSSTKEVWALSSANAGTVSRVNVTDGHFVVFLRAGDSLEAYSGNANYPIDIWYRQIADVNGNLINPLGFSFQ